LGDADAVRAEFDALFPGVAWAWTPTGADHLAAADAAGVALPPALRRTLAAQPSCLCGEVTAGGLVATFNLGPGGPVPAVWATLGGDGPAVAAGLALLQDRPGWLVGPGEGWLAPAAEPGAAADGPRL
jgi:hypothetical protein